MKILKKLMIIYLVIILLLLNCTVNNKLEGVWIVCNSDYEPIENKEYNDYTSLLIENNNVYFGFIDKSNQFIWEKNSVIELNKDSFSIINDSVSKKYFFIFNSKNKAKCDVFEYNNEKQTKRYLYSYLKRIENYNNRGKLKVNNPGSDEYDKIKRNNTIDNSSKIIISDNNLILNFDSTDDVEWFEFEGKEDYVYRIISSYYVPDRFVKGADGVTITINKYVDKNKIFQIVEDQNKDDTNFDYLYWQCCMPGKYHIRISPVANNKNIIGTYKVIMSAESHVGADGGTFQKIIPLKKAKGFKTLHH